MVVWWLSYPPVRVIRFIFLGLALLAGAGNASAQGSLLTRFWQSQDGLPGNVVRSLVQSSDGYLWVATAEGVARFDGFEFEAVEPEGELRRYRLAFSRLFAMPAGGVWAATYQGGLFRVEKGRLHKVLDNLRSPNAPLVTQMVAGENGAVFFKRGTEFGMVVASDEVLDAAPSAELLQSFDKDFKIQQARGRLVDSRGRVVLLDRQGREWVAGAEGGLTWKAGSGVARAVDLAQGGPAFAVSELMEDREGNVWVASPLAGLVRIREARVELLETPQGQGERAASALLQDHSGDWWIAGRSGGLDRWREGVPRHIGLGNRAAAAIFEDRSERLWVASRDGSVYCYNGVYFQAQFTQTQVPSKVRSITQDAEGQMWFGGAQGIASVAGNEVHTYGSAEGVGNQDLTVLQPFPGGKIIAGGTSGQILLGDRRGFETIATPEVLKNQWTSGILPVSAKETWVTTLGSGLFLWDGKKWFCFDANDGLPDSRLTSVVDDGKGCLWLGSLGGIIRADRKELLAHARSPQQPVQWLRLDHTDGLPTRECIGGFQPAGWRAKDGVLWFPTGSGVVRVKPGLIEMSKVDPPVFLKSVRTNGVLHPGETGPVTTEPGRARLEFQYVGLNFSAPEKITYRSRLVGLDDTWRELGSQRTASYEAVPPGRYTFEVVAVNGDGQRSTAPARIAVVIEPHLWESIGFYIAVSGFALGTAVGGGWLAARARMKKRIESLKDGNVREVERSRIARDLHDDLGASLTEISILAALAAEDSDSAGLQPSLEQLSVKAKQVVGSLDEIVWAVNPREDTLRSLIDYVSAFAREFLDIARIPLRLDVGREIPDVHLATTQRHGVFLAARESLNNIVKHSGASEVRLRMLVTAEALEICIADNGHGFAPDVSSGGNGLGNLSQRMQEAGGDCRIESRRDHGTTIFLTLPLLVAGNPIS